MNFMEEAAILEEIRVQLKIQKRNRAFPDHVCGQAGIVATYAGKVMDLAVQQKYGDLEDVVTKSNLRFELLRTAAAAIRMIENL